MGNLLTFSVNQEGEAVLWTWFLSPLIGHALWADVILTDSQHNLIKLVAGSCWDYSPPG